MCNSLGRNDMTLDLTCRAVLFDLDGVLADSRRVVEGVWQVWAAEKGLDPAPFLAIAHGRRTSEILRLVAPHLDIAIETNALDRMEEFGTEGLVLISRRAQSSYARCPRTGGAL